MAATVRDIEQRLADDMGWNLRHGGAVYCRALAASIRPPEPLTVSEWSDAYRKLPKKGASEPGQWRTERTPYLREIMDCLSMESLVRRVVFMSGTQVGKTEVGNNWCGYVMDHAPGPMMVVQPTVDIAKRWSRQRLAAMIEETERLSDIIAPARSRDSGNTTQLKEYPGGVLVISGANSAAGLRSMPVKNLFTDEIDAYPADVDEEGSPIELAERRTATFPRRKILITSTPTLAGCSQIDIEYQASDQRRYHVPCPHCGERQVLQIDQLQDDGRYLCEHCGESIDEHHKTQMLAWGEWIPKHPDRTTRGYHLNSLYSPVGLGYTWSEIAEKRVKAKADKTLEKTFVNTFLGLPYEDLTNRVEPDQLAERRENWRQREIPPGGLILTAGIDVQQNRFAIMIVAWGRNETAWIVDYVEIPGDPTAAESWHDLDQYLSQPIENAYGVAMRPSLIAVDSGNWAHEVYQYVRARRNTIAVKGMATAGKPIIGRSSRQDYNRQGKAKKMGVSVWQIGTDTAKATLYRRIQADADAEAGKRRIRFAADCPDECLEQIASERYDTDRRRWVRVLGRRNEALDCLVYATAAANHPSIRVSVKKDKDWEKIAYKLEPQNGDLFRSAPMRASEPESAETKPAPKRSEPPPKSEGFVKRPGAGFIRRR